MTALPRSHDTVVVGVDGCRAGWVLAAHNGAGFVAIEVETDFAAVVATCTRLNAAVIGVDIPLGFAANGDRPAEAEARRRLGPRRSSMFSTPAHPVLAVTDWAEASALNRSLTGKGLSKQSFHLLPKSREARAGIGDADTERFVEVHPESSFAAMAGHALEPKKSSQGQRQRHDLIIRSLGSFDHVWPSGRTGVGTDDVLDACAAAWTADRVAIGQAELLGDGIDPDGFSLQIAI